MNCREIKLVTSKGNQSEYSLKRLFLKLKFQYFGHLIQSQFVGKDPSPGEKRRQKEKGAAEDEMVR